MHYICIQFDVGIRSMFGTTTITTTTSKRLKSKHVHSIPFNLIPFHSTHTAGPSRTATEARPAGAGAKAAAPETQRATKARVNFILGYFVLGGWFKIIIWFDDLCLGSEKYRKNKKRPSNWLIDWLMIDCVYSFSTAVYSTGRLMWALSVMGVYRTEES